MTNVDSVGEAAVSNYQRVNDLLCSRSPDPDHMWALLRTAVSEPGDYPDLDAIFETMSDVEIILAAMETILVLVVEIGVIEHKTMDVVVCEVGEKIATRY
jgi:hypothetical protein